LKFYNTEIFILTSKGPLPLKLRGQMGFGASTYKLIFGNLLEIFWKIEKLIIFMGI